MAESGTERDYRLGKWLVREDWWIWLLFALALAAGALVYPALPDTIPTHWGLDGKPNGWSSKFTGVFGLLGLSAGIYLVQVFMPLVDPRRRDYTRFLPTLRAIRSLVTVFFLAVWALALGAARGGLGPGLVTALVSLLFILLGNVMGRIRPNWFFGIRTPWTLDSEEVWRRTHRAGGRAMVAGGILGLAGSLIGGVVAVGALLVGLVGAAVFSLVYSYVVWRQVRSGRDS